MKRVLQFIKQNGVGNGEQILQYMQLWFADAANGTYNITFERAKQRRSINQNQLMWLWFSCIAQSWSEATGQTYTKDDVHDAYCLLLLPIDTPKGKIAGRTSGMTTEQMKHFLDQVQADAATEYGIRLPNPEDQLFEIWADEYADK